MEGVEGVAESSTSHRAGPSLPPCMPTYLGEHPTPAQARDAPLQCEQRMGAPRLSRTPGTIAPGSPASGATRPGPQHSIVEPQPLASMSDAATQRPALLAGQGCDTAEARWRF